MSLLKNAMEPCIMLDRRTISDGSGGYMPIWTEGVVFDAAITFDTSIEARVAAKQDMKSLYTVITSKAMNLQYHDVFRRTSDGKIFRVTSDGDDHHTPSSAGLDMRVVSAEEFTIPRE